MAKRFTDTDKWKKPFIRGLNGAYKLLWFYICDDCDHAGIWQVDMEVAALRIGETVTEKTALSYFGEKVVPIDGGAKWFIPSFIDFQYPSGLNPLNKAHGGIIKILEKYGLNKNEIKPLTSPLQGAKVMVMDKDMVKVNKEDVLRVFLQQGGTAQMADQFFNTHEATNWTGRNGQPITNFAPLVSNYITNWKNNENGKRIQSGRQPIADPSAPGYKRSAL